MAQRYVYQSDTRSESASSNEHEARYMIDEDELERLGCRMLHMEVFQHIQNANTNVNNPKMRLQHCCYVQSVGKIPNYRNKPSSTDFQSEDVEKYLESVILYQNATELLQKREEYAVVEDDFGPTLTQMLIRGKKPSFSNLVDACRKFDQEDYIDIHLMTTEISYRHFL